MARACTAITSAFDAAVLLVHAARHHQLWHQPGLRQGHGGVDAARQAGVGAGRRGRPGCPAPARRPRLAASRRRAGLRALPDRHAIAPQQATAAPSPRASRRSPVRAGRQPGAQGRRRDSAAEARLGDALEEVGAHLGVEALRIGRRQHQAGRRPAPRAPARSGISAIDTAAFGIGQPGGGFQARRSGRSRAWSARWPAPSRRRSPTGHRARCR